MSEERVEKIAEVSSKGKTEVKALEEPQERVSPNKERFDTLMQEPGRDLAPAAQPQVKHAPEATRFAVQQGVVIEKTTGDLVVQTQEAINRIEEIKRTLGSPEVSIKHSAQQILQNKLNHIDESLKIALSRAGVEVEPQAIASANSGRVNPIERFLHFLGDGQNQLQNLGHELRLMGLNNKELSPVNMLAIQVKMGQIQQELELFSSLLNKALESIKTIMNIQV